MRLSARVDYALRAAAEIAVAGNHPVTAVQLAEAQGIPPKFLENILGQLRRSGVIRSQRGPDGGYWLARPADRISLADIIRAIDGPLVGVDPRRRRRHPGRDRGRHAGGPAGLARPAAQAVGALLIGWSAP